MKNIMDQIELNEAVSNLSEMIPRFPVFYKKLLDENMIDEKSLLYAALLDAVSNVDMNEKDLIFYGCLLDRITDGMKNDSRNRVYSI